MFDFLKNKKHANSIKTEHQPLIKRGIPEHSYFEIFFEDGSSRTEHDTNWSDISEEVAVMWGGKTKIARVCNQPVTKLIINHAGLSTEMDLQEGEQVYQAIKSYATFTSDLSITSRIIGRVIGRVKNGIVQEEQFIDERNNSITGIKF